MKKESLPLDDKALTVELSKKFLDEIKKLVEVNLNPNGFENEFNKIAQEFQEQLRIPESQRFSLLNILLTEGISSKSKSKIIEIGQEKTLEEILKALAVNGEYNFKFKGGYYSPALISTASKFIDENANLVLNSQIVIPYPDTINVNDHIRNYINKKDYLGLSCQGFLSQRKTSNNQSKFIEDLNQISLFEKSKLPFFDPNQAIAIYSSFLSLGFDKMSLKKLISDDQYCPRRQYVSYQDPLESYGSRFRFEDIHIPPSDKDNRVRVGEEIIRSIMPRNPFSEQSRMIINSTTLNNLVIMVASQIGTYQGGREKYLLAMKSGCFAEPSIPQIESFCDNKLSQTMLILGAIELSAIVARNLVESLSLYQSGTNQRQNKKYSEVYGSITENLIRFTGSLLAINEIGRGFVGGAVLRSISLARETQMLGFDGWSVSRSVPLAGEDPIPSKVPIVRVDQNLDGSQPHIDNSPKYSSVKLAKKTFSLAMAYAIGNLLDFAEIKSNKDFSVEELSSIIAVTAFYSGLLSVVVPKLINIVGGVLPPIDQVGNQQIQNRAQIDGNQQAQASASIVFVDQIPGTRASEQRSSSPVQSNQLSTTTVSASIVFVNQIPGTRASDQEPSLDPASSSAVSAQRSPRDLDNNSV